MHQKEQELLATGYNPGVPLGPLFKTTDKLLVLADAAHIPYTPEQRMQLVQDILKATDGIAPYQRTRHGQTLKHTLKKQEAP